MSGTLFRNIVQLDATPALEGEVEGLETTFIQEEADVLDETDGIEEETSEIDLFVHQFIKPTDSKRVPALFNASRKSIRG